MSEEYSHNDIIKNMNDLPQWEVRLDSRGQFLFRRWDFKENNIHNVNPFVAATTFVDKISILAGKYNHHPDITFGWGYVEVVILTHTKKALTDVDFELAKEIDTI